MRLTSAFDGEHKGVLLCLIIFLIAVPVPAILANLPSVYSAWGYALDANSDWVVEGQAIVNDGNFPERKYPVEPLAALTQEEINRSYVCYIRHYMDLITDGSRPSRSEIRNDATIFASPGEYEPISLCIFALDDANGITTEITDLVSPGGKVIPAENIDIRVTRRLVCRDSHYYYKPLALEKKVSASVNANDTLQYWLTVYIPTDANATVALPTPNNPVPVSWQDAEIVNSAYEANFTVHIPGKADAVFALKVAVLPINLAEPNLFYGMCYLINPPSQRMFPNNINKHMVDMREHGMNSIWTWPDMGRKFSPIKFDWVFDFSVGGILNPNYYYHSLDEIAGAYVNAGFDGYWVNSTTSTAVDIIPLLWGYPKHTINHENKFMDFVSEVRARKTAKGWPSYCLANPIDEPDNINAVPEAVYWANLIKNHYPNESLFVDCTSETVPAELVNTHDILCLYRPSSANKAVIEQAGGEMWTYNAGTFGHAPKWDRLAWGLYNRKTGTKGVFHWVYQWMWAVNGFRYTQPSPTGPIPSPAWEGVREGIDDEKYAQTLMNLVEQIGLSDPCAATAKAAFDQILYPLPGGNNPILPKWLLGDDIATQSIEFDQNRWLMARHILNLIAVVSPPCGALGYNAGDINKDCYVNMLDLAELIKDWLKCTDPFDSINCEFAE